MLKIAFDDDASTSLATASSPSQQHHFRRDLSVSYEKPGDVSCALGETNQALAVFQKALDVAEDLVQRGPNNAELNRDMAVSFAKFAALYETCGDKDKAMAAYIKMRDPLTVMKDRGILAASDERFIGFAEGKITALKKQ